MSKIFIFAPGHDELDKRVLRTIRIFSSKFDSVVVVYESRFSLVREFNHPNNVEIFYVNDTKPTLRVFPKLNPFLNLLNEEEVVNVYVHDSGLLGLLLIKKLRKILSKKAKIIFDYHDFVPWEIYYQLSKFLKVKLLKLPALFLINLVSLYLRRSRSKLFDGLVGISESQIRTLKKFLNYEDSFSSVAIPNTRSLIPEVNYDIKLLDEDFCDFLWVGNVVDGRDLPITLEFLDQIYKDKKFKLYVFGRVISNVVFDLLKTKPYFLYMGEFSSDNDIFDYIKDKKVVSLFFGWDDFFNIGINEISSPNKVYSYANVGVPILLHEKVNFCDFPIKGTLGEVFHDFSSFCEAVSLISSDYINYRERAVLHRLDLVWDYELDIILEKFYDEIYFGVKN